MAAKRIKRVVLTSFFLLFMLWFFLKNPVCARHKPVGLVDQSLLMSHVEMLTQITPRNYQEVASQEQTMEYIEANMKSFGLVSKRQVFTAKGQNFSNVVASYGEDQKKVLVLGAHYDSFDITPGADDNASGVAALLELARMLTQTKPKLNFQVQFVAYANEERPFFRSDDMGSFHHAKLLHEQGKKVVLMLSIEMIGYYSDVPGSQRLPAKALYAVYPDAGNFLAIIGKLSSWRKVRKAKGLFASASVLPVESMNAPASVNGIDRSDHMSYWKFGFPAIMATDTSFYRNPHYHQISDTVDILDPTRMAQAVEGIYGIVMGW